jgi:hypothetical protein
VARRFDRALERSVIRRETGVLLGAFVLAASGALGAEKSVTTFPAPFDSAPWGSLLSKYVDAGGLVSYARWKANAADRGSLTRYLAQFGGPATPAAGVDERVAMLINAYNAFIVETVLDRYPVDGIRAIPGSFTAQTHGIGGAFYSLDEIEHTAVRLGGYRLHAALVCASRSCPPLDRRAFSAADLAAHEHERMRAWMARSDLYRFEPDKNIVFLPKYFDWYRADFKGIGVARVLAADAPERYRSWLARGAFTVEFLDYDWSLNDRDPPGDRALRPE